MNGALQTLTDRGFIRQCTHFEALDALMNQGPVTFYCGFDPTGPSLHAGHLVPLFAMAHLQRAGHKPLALVGGGTARIGDPSGKTETRKMLTVETIDANAESLRAQISKFVDLGPGKGEIVNNADWLTQLNYIDFLRDIGSHFSVNRMLAFETYKMRLETGLSFIEFNYQLLQSYDFLRLHQTKGCVLQIGGDDQWGNIVSGADLVRRIEGKEVYGLTIPLVTRADGKKMGKTEKGSLFLDPAVVPPFEFYQYWRNVPDEDVEKFLLLYTFLEKAEITELCRHKDQRINEAKAVLAFEFTQFIHGSEEAEKCRSAAAGAFSGSVQDLSAIPSAPLDAKLLEAGLSLVDLFALTTLCSSKSEARRLITQGGASVGEEKIQDPERKIGLEFVQEGEILLKGGKKKLFRLIVS